MIELAPYSPFYKAATLRRIDAFGGFHRGVGGGETEDSPAAEDLRRWTDEGHTLLVILEDGADVGFVHLQHNGPIVMELADIFVDDARRGCGIASAAIGLAEEYARTLPGVEAMILQVVTRNEAALRLYHNLGYDTMSMATLRKEFGENRRNRQARFLGLDFKI